MIYRLINNIKYFVDDISNDLVTPYSFNNKPIPRVSDILKNCINEEYIARWANSLGFRHKRYEDELERLANIGSLAHEAIERFFKTGEESDNVCFKGFKLWWDTINKNNKVKLIFSEEEIVTEYVGGTIDALLEINGRYYLVDFKTSTNVTIKHFLQLAAYKYMIHISKGYILDGVIILQLNKKYPAFGEYLLDLNKKTHNDFFIQCQQCCLSMLYQYYNYVDCSRKFGDIFGKHKSV